MKIDYQKICILILASILSACPQSDKNTIVQPDVTQVNTLDAKVVTCEEKMRLAIQDHSVHFQDVKEFQNSISIANQDLILNSEDRISFIQKETETNEYQHETTIIKDNLKLKRSSLIGLNEKDSINPLYFENEFEIQSKESIQKIYQRYTLNSMDGSCEMLLSSTNVTDLIKVSDQKYTYKFKSISYDSVILSDETQNFELHPDQILSDFSDEPVDLNIDNLKKTNFVEFIPTFGVVDFSANESEASELYFYGTNLKFRNLDLKLNLSSKSVLNLKLSIDEKLKISITQNSQEKTWNMPFEKYFPMIHLGQASISSQNAISKLDSEYQNKNNKFELMTHKKIIFDNFSAYFKILSEKTDSNKNQYIYSLQENYLPTSTSLTTSSDLTSNDTIQTELPEIQKIAQDILRKTNGQRADQIQKILNYLKENYVYDYEMLKRNVIRPLTTKEALDRKKGVCQHYAVLFTAIARALKIPSRIIVGYYISGEHVSLHAWVEAEISNNMWQVIEPQSQNGLTQTYTRFYFPLTRASFLENKDEKPNREYIEFLINNQFQFLKTE